MKKFYLFLLAIVACFATASAADWDIILKVKGADRVKAVIGTSITSETAENVALVDGDNPITIPSGKSLFVDPLYPEDIVSFKNSEGKQLSQAMWNTYYEIYASSWGDPVSPYTLTVLPEEEYRDKSVTITTDDCTKVKIIRADNSEFEPKENTFEFRYNSTEETKITIKPRSWSDFIYSVSVDGVAVPKSTDRFYINLVDNSGDEPVYVKDINVMVNAPEGVTFHTSFELEGDKEMIEYISVDSEDLEDLSAAITDGFDVTPGANVRIGFNPDYKIEKITDNGEDRSVSSYLTLDQVGCDHKLNIKGRLYAKYNVRFNITCPEGIKASLGSTTLDFKEGVNDIEFSEKNNYVTFSEMPGYYFESFFDKNGYDYLEDGNYSYFKKVYINAEAGEEYTIVAKKIRRDDVLSFYLDDLDKVKDDIYSYSGTAKFTNYDTFDKPTSGYNIINFRPQDGKFTCYYYGHFKGFFAYLNDEAIDTKGYNSVENLVVTDKDVVKVFFLEDPSNHTVTFDDPDNALGDFEVKKDIVAAVDPTAPVKAIGHTRFTITPVTRAEKEIAIKIGDTEVLPADGVYTFDTDADTTVSVSTRSTSGIEDVISGQSTTSDVYNLQGIRVATDANADDIKALPAGIYIINGAKVLVK